MIHRSEMIHRNSICVLKDSPLAKIKWKRIILDEAHRIKNHSTKANKVICALKAKYRIAITGTPIHNSLNDLYSLVKFLHFEPLDQITLWRYVFASETFTSKSAQNANSLERQKRLDNWMVFLSDYLILRRTKNDKFKGTEKRIVDLPDKSIEVVKFQLESKEKMIYEKIFKESKEKVNKFLSDQQRKILGKISKSAGSSNVSEIFVYLLRLRQACCHMSLLAECLDRSELENAKIESEGLDTMMENLTLKSEPKVHNETMNDQIESLDTIKQDVDLTVCLEKSFKSSKIGKLIDMVEKVLDEEPTDKLIIVSQWVGVLNIVAKCLRKKYIEYCEIKGDIKLFERNEIVESFNCKENTQLRVMLLSLTAGGVGLNLIGANRMFLLDM